MTQQPTISLCEFPSINSPSAEAPWTPYALQSLISLMHFFWYAFHFSFLYKYILPTSNFNEMQSFCALCGSGDWFWYCLLDVSSKLGFSVSAKKTEDILGTVAVQYGKKLNFKSFFFFPKTFLYWFLASGLLANPAICLPNIIPWAFLK